MFPQTFRMQVDTSLPIDEQRKRIKEQAAYLMGTSQSEPVITYCSNDESGIKE
jgi:hypothetical protein